MVKRFDELNAQLFRNMLPQPTFAISQHEDRFAWFVPAPLRIIMFHPRVLEQDPRWISDSLLHEMVHFELDVENGDSDQQHGRRFVTRANQLSRMLGLRRVAPGSDAAVEWPQSVRKKGYAAWRPPE